jgi:hypothetical protein
MVSTTLIDTIGCLWYYRHMVLYENGHSVSREGLKLAAIDIKDKAVVTAKVVGYGLLGIGAISLLLAKSEINLLQEAYLMKIGVIPVPPVVDAVTHLILGK